MYTIIIGGCVPMKRHDYAPDSFEEAVGVARELSRDYPGRAVSVFLGLFARLITFRDGVATQ